MGMPDFIKSALILLTVICLQGEALTSDDVEDGQNQSLSDNKEANSGAPELWSTSVDWPNPTVSGPGLHSPSGPPEILSAKAPTESSTGFQWKSALLQSTFLFGVEHAFRFVTEAGTRDTLHGPFLRDYFRSVLSLRGWDDGDGFVTSYVAHPMGGAVYGFIQQQNDPLYRAVEFGDGRPYWISRLRAFSYSAVWSTLWTLGPASEASLGNVQLHASPGFVDLVVSPVLGVGWMMAEDVVDRYLISYLENRTTNPWILMAARSFGNPTRGFAKMMSLKRPWERDTRPGLWGENRTRRAEALKDLPERPALGAPAIYRYNSVLDPASENGKRPQSYPLEAPVEIMATAHYEWFVHGGACVGGGGTGSARLNSNWQIAAEVTGCMMTGLTAPHSGDSLTYLVGPRWTPRASRKVSPYAQLLAGGRRVTQEIPDPVKQQQLLDAWNTGRLEHYPMRSDYQVELQANGFALVGGGGLDVLLNRAVALRIFNLEYTHAWLPPVGRLDASQGIRLETGMILRIGTW